MRFSFRPLARFGAALVLTFNFSLLTAAGQAPKTYTSSEILLGLKKLNVLGSVLYIAAHPDDENTRLLAYLANERLVETGYLSCTRGDGGQNLIGPELREQLGVIRTQELLAARRIDGAKQFFTRANDFGFSKTAEETFTIWDKEQVLADMVWVIRQRRPDVLITRFPPDSRAGHGHHTASALLAIEAFAAAGDAKRFPEQLQYVQPWQPKRLLWNNGSFFIKPGEDLSKFLKLDVGGYNPLLGQSYGEIAARSRSQHRSQGFGSAAQRGELIEYFTPLREGDVLPKELLEGVDLSWNRVPGGAAVGKLVEDVIKKFDPSKPEASVAGLVKVQHELVSLPVARDSERSPLYSIRPISIKKGDVNLQPLDYFWRVEKLAQIDELLKACLGLSVEAITDEPTITKNEGVGIKVNVVSRSSFHVQVATVNGAAYYKERAKLPGGVTIAKKNQLLVLDDVVGVAQPATSQPYWLVEPGTSGMYKVSRPIMQGFFDASSYARGSNVGIIPNSTHIALNPAYWDSPLLLIGKPENPPVATVKLGITFATERGKNNELKDVVEVTVPVQYKHTDPSLGELYQPLVVVPPVMVNLPAARAYVFADQGAKEVPVTLRAGRAGVQGTLSLQVPKGWEINPASAAFSLKGKDEEQTFIFSVKPGKDAAAGHSELRATATVDGQAYSRGMQQIVYPHIPTQTLFPEATSPLVKLNVSRGKTQNVGYLMGAGDEVPEALRQLGYTVTLLDAHTDLTVDRLRRFDAVVLGVRAYNTVEKLKTQQPELLRYVEQGGNLVVQYVTSRGTLIPEIGPFPMKLSSDRVTVENAPVTFVNPKHPLLNTPNKITAEDFQGWVQEQGLYYPSSWDAKYTPVISSADPGEKAKESAILVADYGKGHYIYTGLSFFREVPAGVPGAYRLLANLVSYGK